MDLLPFQPPPYARSGHIQTLWAYFQSSLPGYKFGLPGLLQETAVIRTQDDSGDRLVVHIHRIPESGAQARLYPGSRYRVSGPRPVVVIVHGLEGDADSVYVIRLTEKLLRAGFHVARMNMRSCGPGKDLAANAYNAGLTIDVESVCDYARERVSPRVALVGISLGANLTLKFLGETPEERNHQLDVLQTAPRRKRTVLPEAFAAISPPLDLQRSCELLDAPPCRLYRRSFLTDIKNRARAGMIGPRGLLERELEQAQTFFDFDHRFVAPTGGYRGAIEYYTHCAGRNYVEKIQIPGLLLHAMDDPIIHPSGWEAVRWDQIPHITAHATQHGGHVGWIAKKQPFLPDRRWMDYRVMTYLTDWRDSL